MLNSQIDSSIDKVLSLSDKERYELYLHYLKKAAEDNTSSNRISLTNLYNIRAFFYTVTKILANNKNTNFAIIVFDIANFKMVNEFCGRKEGDRLLCYIADCFRSYETESTIASHFRADIFALFGPFDEEQVTSLVTNITEKLSRYPLSCKILPSFGIYMDKDHTIPISLMCDYAMIALKTIKGKLFSNYAFFDETMKKQMLREKQIENHMVAGMENREFQVYIQPKVNMKTGKILGGEALVRWQHPDFGFIAPNLFLPVFEKDGFIINLDNYVWEEVFSQMAKRSQENKKIVPLSLNVSRLHVYDKNFQQCLCHLSEQYEIDPHNIFLELTESVFLENTEYMFENMHFLQSKGFSFSMDDFGSGYSSMNMLKSQPVDEVKIDREFLNNIEEKRSQIIIRHTIQMLQELEIKILVEGVETEQQKEFLLSCDCTDAQGYLFYRPMPAKEFWELLDSQ